MAIQPNVVVGVTGILIVAVVGSVLAANWNDLAGIHRFQTRVVGDDSGRDLAASQPADGSDRTYSLLVPQDNVTTLRGFLRWRDNTPPDADAMVRLTIVRPDGTQVYEATGTSGLRGLEFEFELGPTPGPRSYRETNASAEARFARDYPGADVGTGDWTFTIRASYDGGSPLGAGSIDWRLGATWEFYTAYLEPAPDIDFRGK